jgi:Uma2 family endonuclease
MPARTENARHKELLKISDELGIRIEMANGMPTWESQPVIKHQRALKRIMESIQVARQSGSDCACVWYPDVEVRFQDGSFKRPDIAIWCREPDEDEEAVTLIPEAVIEIISKGFEKKDTEIGAPFYLSMGVKDVVLFDPYNSRVEHRSLEGTKEIHSPARIELACGCECTV